MKDEAQEVLFLSVPSLDLPHYSFLLQDRLNVAGPPCYLVYRYIRGKSIFSIVQRVLLKRLLLFLWWGMQDAANCYLGGGIPGCLWTTKISYRSIPFGLSSPFTHIMVTVDPSI